MTLTEGNGSPESLHDLQHSGRTDSPRKDLSPADPGARSPWDRLTALSAPDEGSPDLDLMDW